MFTPCKISELLLIFGVYSAIMSILESFAIFESFVGVFMASVTKKLKVRRALRVAGAGKSRKNRVRREGSTPVCLPLNKPNENELAQKKARQA